MKKENFILAKLSEFIGSTPPKQILLVDSTEKCAGTTIKHHLRINFPEENFFDLDNGDPPSENIRNYGIKCPIHFNSYDQFLRSDQSNFYDIFNTYINHRADWLIDNINTFNVRCVYGNGIFHTPLYLNLKRYYQVKICKFFRDPASRLASEYFYVLNHLGHNLHAIARDSGSLEGYARNSKRPKNRQTMSVLGYDAGDESYPDVASTFNKINETYYFVGLVENYDADMARLSKSCGLSKPRTEKRNLNTSRKWSPKELNDLNSLIREYDSADFELYTLIKNMASFKR